MVLPIINLVQALMRMAGSTSADSSGAMKPPSSTEDDATTDREYELMMAAVLADGAVDPAERALLAEFAAEHGVSDEQHAELLRRAGWTTDEYAAGAKSTEPAAQ